MANSKKFFILVATIPSEFWEGLPLEEALLGLKPRALSPFFQFTVDFYLKDPLGQADLEFVQKYDITNKEYRPPSYTRSITTDTVLNMYSVLGDRWEFFDVSPRGTIRTKWLRVFSQDPSHLIPRFTMKLRDYCNSLRSVNTFYIPPSNTEWEEANIPLMFKVIPVSLSLE